VCVCSVAPSVRSPYSEVSSVCVARPSGQPPDSREMFNPSMTPGACMEPYMRPPHAPPPHGMMGHRGMPPPEGETVFTHRSRFIHISFKYLAKVHLFQ